MRKKMSKQRQTPEPSVYQLKIVLQGSKPPIWRRIQVPSDTSLDGLHRILQVVMGWSNSHLHQFEDGNLTYGPPDPNFPDFDVIDEKDVVLSEVVSRSNQKFLYQYDFGDDWTHLITLEEMLPPEDGATYPLCLTGKRACPPEDSGGIFAYPDFLEAISESEHPHHMDMLRWVGGGFDPEAFDRAGVNRSLMGIKYEAEKYGRLRPRYAFILNPHLDFRCTKCPQCEGANRLRKVPLLIHVERIGHIALSMASRFCPKCYVVIVHQDKLEAELVQRFGKDGFKVGDTGYFVIGTVDSGAWRKSLRGAELTSDELRRHTADFRKHLTLEFEDGPLLEQSTRFDWKICQ